MAEETTKEWWQEDGVQNLLVNALQLYDKEREAKRPVNTADTSGAQAGLQAYLAANKAGGMDFSAYAPLLGVIGDQSYTRDNAIKDSDGFIKQIFADYEKSSLPKIYSNPRASGIFNDTSTQLLANDAFSSSVAKGQANLFQNIMAYSQARKNQLDPVMQLMMGQVSNANTVTNANAQITGYGANALQAGINQANADGTAQGAKKPGATTQDYAGIAGSLVNMYQNYQNSQQANASANNEGNSMAGSSTTPVTNYDDDYYYGEVPDYLNTPYNN